MFNFIESQLEKYHDDKCRIFLEDRIKKYSKLNEKTGCIEWTGARHSFGYGVLTISKNNQKLNLHVS